MRKVSIAILLTAYLFVVFGGATADEPGKTVDVSKASSLPALDGRLKCSLADAHVLRNKSSLKGSARTLDGPAQIEQGTKKYFVVNLEFADADSCRAFKMDGARVITRFDKFADAFVLMGDEGLNALNRSRGIVWFEVAAENVVPPPARVTSSPETPRAIEEPEEIVHGNIDDFTGKGVIVAVIDTGVDFHHPDFIVYDSSGEPTSRLLYFWDTFSDACRDGVGTEPKIEYPNGTKVGIEYPNGAPIGTVFSREDLTAELRSKRPRILEWDSDGHGTACAGIAAGNGNASLDKNGLPVHSGVAPQADIIAVRVGGAGRGLKNSYLLGAICEWIDKTVGDRPAVLSCSFGGQYGGRDGFGIAERQLNARFPADGRGRAICIAAGNERMYPIHSGFTVNGEKQPAKLNWQSSAGAIIEIYFQTDRIDDLVCERVGKADTDPLDDPHSTYPRPLTNHLVRTFVADGGDGELAIWTKSGNAIQADAYIVGPSGGIARFSPECATAEKMVGAPGTAANAITVGSYDWNDRWERHGKREFLAGNDENGNEIAIQFGRLSNYSSPGPTRFGSVTKPDIAAPGQWFVACATLNATLVRDTTGNYRTFRGTSAATPYVAGVVALILQKQPQITLGELKELVNTSATKDSTTGDVPNSSWGHGKLDIDAVRRLLAKVGQQKQP